MFGYVILLDNLWVGRCHPLQRRIVSPQWLICGSQYQLFQNKFKVLNCMFLLLSVLTHFSALLYVNKYWILLSVLVDQVDRHLKGFQGSNWIRYYLNEFLVVIYYPCLTFILQKTY